MNRRGFTLIEVMISVAIIAGMGLIIQGTLRGALGAKNRVERKNELLRGVQVGISKMTGDLGCAFLANASLKGTETAYETGMKGGEDHLDFSTLGHFHYVENATDTDQVTVGYSLKKEGEYSSLYRRESQRLSEKIDEGGTSFALIENIREFKLQYYDSSKEEWVSEWDTSQISVLGRLPRAVKIEIKVAELDETEEEPKVVREHSFTTIAPVFFYKNEISF